MATLHTLPSRSRYSNELVIENQFAHIPQNFFRGATFVCVVCPSIVTIGDNAFQYCAQLKQVSNPNNVRLVGSSAFYECIELESIDLPSVTSIGKNAFAKCKRLKRAYVPVGTTQDDTGMYRHCSSLVHATIAEGVTCLPKLTFEECVSLNTVTLPQSIRSIEYGCFAHCRILTGSKLPNGLQYIGPFAFRSTNIESAVIPDTVKSVGGYAFYHCTNLNKIVFGNGVTHIEDSCCKSCSALNEVTLSDNTVTIGPDAFAGCVRLCVVNVPHTLQAIARGAFERPAANTRPPTLVVRFSTNQTDPNETPSRNFLNSLVALGKRYPVRATFITLAGDECVITEEPRGTRSKPDVARSIVAKIEAQLGTNKFTLNEHVIWFNK